MAYPNFENKHLEEPLFTPHDFFKYSNRKITNFPKKWIITWQNSVVEHLQKKHKLRKTKKLGFQGDVFLVDGIGLIKMNGIGSPHAVTNCEEMIARGAEELILIGTAGGLKSEGIFICEKSIRDEGTSSHYEAHSKYSYPDKELTEKIKEILDKSKIPFELGISWTIDAPYRETKKEVAHYKKEGVATVEMESSALFALGKFRKVKFAAIFAVSDVLGEEKWEPKFDAKHVKENLNKAVNAILDSKW